MTNAKKIENSEKIADMISVLPHVTKELVDALKYEDDNQKRADILFDYMKTLSREKSFELSQYILFSNALMSKVKDK